MTTYRITTTDGRSHDDVYASVAEAAVAVRTMMGWDGIVTSEAYAFDCGHIEAVSCYSSEFECDADDEGAYAPKIVEVATCRCTWQ